MDRLEEELAWLRAVSGKGKELQVRWIPDINSTKEGEVCGRTVYIYSETIDKAVQTLRHEFLDYLVCNTIEPYQELVNALLAVLSEKAYRRKEEVIESILKILQSPLSHKDLAVL
ncbi:MAG: hypothetical protein ACREA3_05195 [Nitrosotalea sp.]